MVRRLHVHNYVSDKIGSLYITFINSILPMCSMADKIVNILRRRRRRKRRRKRWRKSIVIKGSRLSKTLGSCCSCYLVCS